MGTFAFCFIFIQSSFAFGASTAPKASVTVDNRYLSGPEQVQDMRGLPQFGYEVALLRGKVLGALTDKTFMGNTSFRRSLLFFSTEVLGAYYMDLSFNTAFHELGHASRMAAMGIGYSFDQGEKDFFPYYFSKLGKSGGATYFGKQNFKVPMQNRFLTPENETSPYAEILISSAGINSETFYSGYLASKGLAEGYHTSHFMSYTLAKLNSYIYPENISGTRFGDVANILDSYRALGVGNFTEKDIKNYSLFTFLGSASTWRYLKAVSNYLGTGETSISVKKTRFQVPELEAYYTSKGLSVKTISSYQLTDSLRLPVSVEHVFRGKHVTEVGFGAGYELKTDLLDLLSFNLLMGLSPGGRVDYQFEPWSDTRFNVGVNIDNLNSLDGERNIVSLKHGEINPSFVLKATRFF